MGTKYSELVFGPWRNIGIDQNQQIEIVRWLLGPNEDNTRVNSEYVEEEGENSGDGRWHNILCGLDHYKRIF
jgi:hypothetical protein